MKVLSLFDGMACGMIAMLNAGIKVDSYDAYEIDKYAIKTATHNFPQIAERGDVFKADFTQLNRGGIDFLIGGSPCTHWSIAQTKNRESTVSRDENGNLLLHSSGIGFELFSQYLRALQEVKPKYFIYENNKSMSKEIRAAITECFGFEPICINSALVSAQNRQRLYWVGKRNDDGTYSKVPVQQPKDRGILLKDVLDSGFSYRNKSTAIASNRGGMSVEHDINESRHTLVAEPIGAVGNIYGKGQNGQLYSLDSKAKTLSAGTGINGRGIGSNNAPKVCIPITDPVCVAERGRMYRGEPQHYESREDGKTNMLTSVEKDNRVAIPVLSEAEMDYMVRDHQDRRWNFCNKPGERDKSECITANISKGVPYNLCAEPIQIGRMPREDGEVTGSKQYRVYGINGKAVTQCGQGGGLGAKTGLYAVPVDGDYEYVDYVINENAIRSVQNKNGASCAESFVEFTDRKSQSLISARANKIICELPIPTMQVAEATERGYTEIELGDCVDLSMPNSKTRIGRNMTDKANCMQTSNEFYQYVGYAIEFDENGKPTKAIGKNGKEITIYEVRDGKITIKDKQYPIKLKDGFYIIRKLTVSECKRLQTVPEWYDFSCVSDSQAYKMLGNGWTCDVITHLINACLSEETANFDETDIGMQYKLF